MTWSNNGQILISGDHAGIIKYFNSSITFVNSISEAHNAAIRGLSFSPNDTKFVSCSEDKSVRVWDWERAEAESVLEEHLSDVRCCAWHPYRSLIVSGSKDNTVKLWDPRQGTAVTTIFSHKNSILCCGWSLNGHWLATGARDQLAKIFDIRVMRDMATLRGHSKEVCSLAWHPVHDTVLLTGGFNGTMIYWLVGHEGPHTIIANAHNYSVNMVAWHPIGHTVATASNDGILKFWSREPPGSKLDLEPGEWAEQLQTQHGPMDPSLVTAVVASYSGTSTTKSSMMSGQSMMGGSETQIQQHRQSRAAQPSSASSIHSQPYAPRDNRSRPHSSSASNGGSQTQSSSQSVPSIYGPGRASSQSSAPSYYMSSNSGRESNGVAAASGGGSGRSVGSASGSGSVGGGRGPSDSPSSYGPYGPQRTNRLGSASSLSTDRGDHRSSSSGAGGADRPMGKPDMYRPMGERGGDMRGGSDKAGGSFRPNSGRPPKRDRDPTDYYSPQPSPSGSQDGGRNRVRSRFH
eukprot:CAMPEP_0182417584 /NCGR_PEP_ID=MMETSP1167-20130531/2046_1 /TAXON_ID=2988 /ORGANISM="Mallomonas Sp, Strain CCMP3275" /LENGTH=517 /DNA_ID=CAMNT_0024591249 /DNA_START=529 /DNA_END=2082 /DNA_ORIENTATION=-